MYTVIFLNQHVSFELCLARNGDFCQTLYSFSASFQDFRRAESSQASELLRSILTAIFAYVRSLGERRLVMYLHFIARPEFLLRYWLQSSGSPCPAGRACSRSLQTAIGNFFGDRTFKHLIP